MPKQITIQSVAFDWPVDDDQVVTIAHKKTIDPDTSFVVDTTAQIVKANGQLDPAYVIAGLDFDTRYTVRIFNSCGTGEEAYITLLTGTNPCPDISRVYGQVIH